MTPPDNWTTGTLPELISADGLFIDGDWVESKDQDPNGDVRLIQLADVGDGKYRDRSNRFLTREKAGDLRCTFLKPDDILVARMPDPLGRACIFPGDSRPSVTVVDVCIVRTAPNGVNNRWLMWTINSPQIRTAIESLESGTTRKRISRKNLSKIEFPIPPIPEQHRIVNKIEELFTQLDAGVELLQKTKVLLNQYRQSVLKAAFEGKLTEEWRGKNRDRQGSARQTLIGIQLARGVGSGDLPKVDGTELPTIPEEWEWTTLPMIGELNRGKSKHRPRDDPKLYGGSYPFIQTGDVRNSNGRITEFRQTYNELGLRQSKLWQKGTLCITIAANIAETGILELDACFPDSIVGFTCEPNQCNTRFVEFFLRSVKSNIERYAPATAQKNINLQILSSLAVPFPPLQEQQAIVDSIDEHFSIADSAEKAMEKNLRLSGTMKQGILNKAFQGKLVPQDPADEPASKLLERLKVQRSGETPRGRKPRQTKMF